MFSESGALTSLGGSYDHLRTTDQSHAPFGSPAAGGQAFRKWEPKAYGKRLIFGTARG